MNGRRMGCSSWKDCAGRGLWSVNGDVFRERNLLDVTVSPSQDTCAISCSSTNRSIINFIGYENGTSRVFS